MNLGFKPDFAESAARFEAWWHNGLLDRPVVTAHARPVRPVTGTWQPRDQQDAWTNVRGVVDRAVAAMAAHEFVGDTLPIFWPNLGPVITAALWGAQLQFAPDTVWCDPIYRDTADWETFLAAPPDFSTPHWQTVEAMTDYALEICDGRFLTGITDLHGNYDILAALRGPEELCLDMLEAPDLVARAALHAAEGYNAAFRRSWAKLQDVGSTGWTPLYHRGPAFIPSCDFWCMVSPQMGRDLVLPSIRKEMEPLDRSIFHLDGPQALPHLDALLELPELHAIQWVYGAGQGPAARWLDVYRRIRKAGKAMQVLAHTPADALAVLDAVGPEGLWLLVHEAFPTPRDARAFVEEVARRSKRARGVP